MVQDPDAKKPEDWVDEAQIADPSEVKPDDWEQPEMIVDPEASQPEDWDVEEDGEWEAPQISNPAYKGEWRPSMIDNPAYKGEWEVSGPYLPCTSKPRFAIAVSYFWVLPWLPELSS
jgi:calreticulin